MMNTGTVKMYNEGKGWGFIVPDGGGPDVFFHISRCDPAIESLRTGDRVQFIESVNARNQKPEAINVSFAAPTPEWNGDDRRNR
jgi:CspA family cold shock protein